MLQGSTVAVILMKQMHDACTLYARARIRLLFLLLLLLLLLH
jgi:hypothetical protein